MTTKIVLIVFTTANDSPNLAQCLFDGFNDLEKRKHKNFPEKHNAGACANIEKKPSGAPLSQFMTSTKLTHSPTKIFNSTCYWCMLTNKTTLIDSFSF